MRWARLRQHDVRGPQLGRHGRGPDRRAARAGLQRHRQVLHEHQAALVRGAGHARTRAHRAQPHRAAGASPRSPGSPRGARRVPAGTRSAAKAAGAAGRHRAGRVAARARTRRRAEPPPARSRRREISTACFASPDSTSTTTASPARSASSHAGRPSQSRCSVAAWCSGSKRVLRTKADGNHVEPRLLQRKPAVLLAGSRTSCGAGRPQWSSTVSVARCSASSSCSTLSGAGSSEADGEPGIDEADRLEACLLRDTEQQRELLARVPRRRCDQDIGAVREVRADELRELRVGDLGRRRGRRHRPRQAATCRDPASNASPRRAA